MATVFALVNASANSLRYLVTSAGATAGSILAAGSTTPDLLTDSKPTSGAFNAGPLFQIMNVQNVGVGTIVAGTLSTGQANALLMSDNSTNIGTADVPRAVVRVTPVTGAGADWRVSVAASANQLQLTATAAAAGTCYIDLEIIGAIGR